MDRENLDFLSPMFKQPLDQLPFKLLIVNQTQGDPLISNFQHIRVINSDEYGLSKSRNLALENATSKIILVTDDDVKFIGGFHLSVIKEFNKVYEPSGVVFKVRDSRLSRNYPIAGTKISLNELSGVASIELAFVLKRLRTNNLRFDERFGLGTKLPVGEEYLFCREALIRDLQIFQSDHLICEHSAISTGERSDNKVIIRARAAINHLEKKMPDLIWAMKYAVWLWRNNYISASKMPTVVREARRGVDILKSYDR